MFLMSALRMRFTLAFGVGGSELQRSGLAWLVTFDMPLHRFFLQDDRVHIV